MHIVFFKVSSRPDCIFEIYQLWQSGFSGVYFSSCCSCSFEHEIIKISQSSHKMYSNNIVNFQDSTTILNACIKKSGNLLNAPRIYMYYTQNRRCLKLVSSRMRSSSNDVGCDLKWIFAQDAIFSKTYSNS